MTANCPVWPMPCAPWPKPGPMPSFRMTWHAARMVKTIAPTLHLHGSTQMSIHTPEGARELAALGYDRVILARELSLEEIRAVCAASPIEVEVFVHGRPLHERIRPVHDEAPF